LSDATSDVSKGCATIVDSRPRTKQVRGSRYGNGNPIFNFVKKKEKRKKRRVLPSPFTHNDIKDESLLVDYDVN
jgi:hypothetical protein